MYNIIKALLQVRSPGEADGHGGDGARLLPPGGEGSRETLQHQLRLSHRSRTCRPGLAHPLPHQHPHASQQPGAVKEGEALDYELN